MAVGMVSGRSPGKACTQPRRGSVNIYGVCTSVQTLPAFVCHRPPCRLPASCSGLASLARTWVPSGAVERPGKWWPGRNGKRKAQRPRPSQSSAWPALVFVSRPIFSTAANGLSPQQPACKPSVSTCIKEFSPHPFPPHFLMFLSLAGESSGLQHAPVKVKSAVSRLYDSAFARGAGQAALGELSIKPAVSYA